MSFSITRIDLADTGSPEGLVTAIFKVEKKIQIPVPIDQLCRHLDIVEIQSLKTEGFEGGLLTQRLKTNGIILVKGSPKNNGDYSKRQRFTIAHELGHFLIPSHVPSRDESFLCSRADMLRQPKKDQDKQAKMEVEANRFASLILMPPPMLREILNGKPYPNLKTIVEIHNHFDVSKEAAARAYAEYNPETVAVVVVHNGKYLRSYRNKAFPWVSLVRGQKIPESSLLYSYTRHGEPSHSDETDTAPWIETERGRSIPKMYEQVMHQSKGFAMIQLKIFEPDIEEYDEYENLTSKERYARQSAKWRL
ncbi:MAG: ImmA/IrrE family metallo-endopeptidase [Bacteroidetes bacterium]|nr:ImmA/IrrE family metallo-endopeptidase [Bacteroidota bacterium]